jgi:hypothetical protein
MRSYALAAFENGRLSAADLDYFLRQAGRLSQGGFDYALADADEMLRRTVYASDYLDEPRKKTVYTSVVRQLEKEGVGSERRLARGRELFREAVDAECDSSRISHA